MFDTDRIAITNLQHQYVSVSPQAALQSGYSKVDEMLGTTLFDLRTQVVEVAGFVQQINQRVLDSKKNIIVFDITEYEQGLDCCTTVKSPLFNEQHDLLGVKTCSTLLKHEQLTPFIKELYTNSKKLEQRGKFKSQVFEVVERYAEHNLTVAESKILFLLAYAKTGANIAHLLSRSTRTIEGAIEHIKHKLDLYSKPQLVEYAIQTGLTRLIPQGLVV